MILLLSLACLGPRDGTAVGNPGDAGMVGSDEGGRMAWHWGSVRAKAAVAEQRGEKAGLFLGSEMDLLGELNPMMRLSPGRYEGLYLYIDRLTLVGHSDQGVLVDIEVQPSRLCVEGDFGVVEDDALLLRFPLDRVVDVDALHATGLQELVIRPGDPEAEALAMELELLPELWRDLDRDGQVSDGDRLIETNWGPLE